jgi:hypothetical protein
MMEPPAAAAAAPGPAAPAAAAAARVPMRKPPVGLPDEPVQLLDNDMEWTFGTLTPPSELE